MRGLILLRSWRIVLPALGLALLIAFFAAPQRVRGPNRRPPQVADAQMLPSTRPTTSLPSAAPSIVPSSPPPTATATAVPTTMPTTMPTATPGPQRIGLQVGHWRADELPDELAQLRGNTGAAAASYTEAEINLLVGQRTAALLTAQGFVVDLLPATIPPGYKADAFVAIHADGSPGAAANGFKVATPWRTSRAAQHLLESLVAEYAAATALPQDGGITFNMRGYYAFSRRFRHTIDRTTPAVIIEIGFLTNPGDRALLTGQPDRVAQGIASGITRYLAERDPDDRAAMEPPSFAMQRARSAEGADVRAAPSLDAPVLLHVTPQQLLVPFDHKDGWYQVVVRGNWQIVGWVVEEQLRATSDPFPTN